MPRIGLIDRISLDERTGCWNWKGPVDSKFGYGKTKLGGKFISAHRLSALLWLRIDRHDPRCVLHKCDNPRCFNPKHLYMGTLKDNSKDCSERGRNFQKNKTVCSNGHLFNEKNTHSYFITRIRKGKLSTSFERKCRACQREYTRTYLLNKRNEQKGELPSRVPLPQKVV